MRKARKTHWVHRQFHVNKELYETSKCGKVQMYIPFSTDERGVSNGFSDELKHVDCGNCKRPDY